MIQSTWTILNHLHTVLPSIHTCTCLCVYIIICTTHHLHNFILPRHVFMAPWLHGSQPSLLSTATRIWRQSGLKRTEVTASWAPGAVKHWDHWWFCWITGDGLRVTIEKNSSYVLWLSFVCLDMFDHCISSPSETSNKFHTVTLLSSCHSKTSTTRTNFCHLLSRAL